jgi:lipopolysaccharide export LptBFGC system permease protein LptF
MLTALQAVGTSMKTAFHVLFALALVLGLASSVLANVQ